MPPLKSVNGTEISFFTVGEAQGIQEFPRRIAVPNSDILLLKQNFQKLRMIYVNTRVTKSISELKLVCKDT